MKLSTNSHIEKIIETVMHRLLKENNQDSPDLGSIEFSPSRKDGVSRNEPNTRVEDKIEKALNAWINFNRSPDSNTVAQLQSLLSSRYNSYFSPPSAETIYRGIARIDAETLANWLGRSIPEDEYEGEETIQYTHHPRGLATVTSWSPDIETAEGFALWDEDKREDEFSVILTASSSENPNILLDLTNIQNTTEWFPPFGESEILALGPVNVKKISWRKG